MNDKNKENYIAYVLGRVETQVEGYAASSQIPLGELSRFVGEFLCGKAGGQLLRGVHNMPTLSKYGRRIGRPRKEGRPSVAEMALPGNAHSNMWTPEQRAKLSKAMKAKWAERRAAAAKPQRKKPAVHWTQTPEGRKKLAVRAKEFWKKGVWGKKAQK